MLDYLFVDFHAHCGLVSLGKHAADETGNQAGLADSIGAHHADFLLDHRAASFPVITRNLTRRLSSVRYAPVARFSGWREPRATIRNISGLTPRLTSAFSTTSARNWLSLSFLASSPLGSVLPCSSMVNFFPIIAPSFCNLEICTSMSSSFASCSAES